MKHILSKTDKDCSTRFLERDGSTLSCPYHTCYDEKGVPSNVQCGDWCPMLSYDEKLNTVYLLCGSGEAAYQLDENESPQSNTRRGKREIPKAESPSS